MDIPLQLRLKRRVHRDMARVQDEVVELVYVLEDSAVLHGGTAIWRCFKGNRFSEDLDFYCVFREGFQEKVRVEAERRGMQVTKFRKTSNAIYSRISKENVQVSLEFSLRRFLNPSVSPYERVDGTFMDVFTPSVSELLIEKLHAFRNRRLARDMYDVYHLTKMTTPNSQLTKIIFPLLKNLPGPVDESNLKAVILSGIIPSFSQMESYVVSRWKNEI